MPRGFAAPRRTPSGAREAALTVPAPVVDNDHVVPARPQGRRWSKPARASISTRSGAAARADTRVDSEVDRRRTRITRVPVRSVDARASARSDFTHHTPRSRWPCSHSAASARPQPGRQHDPRFLQEIHIFRAETATAAADAAAVGNCGPVWAGATPRSRGWSSRSRSTARRHGSAQSPRPFRSHPTCRAGYRPDSRSGCCRPGSAACSCRSPGRRRPR